MTTLTVRRGHGTKTLWRSMACPWKLSAMLVRSTAWTLVAGAGATLSSGSMRTCSTSPGQRSRHCQAQPPTSRRHRPRAPCTAGVCGSCAASAASAALGAEVPRLRCAACRRRRPQASAALTASCARGAQGVARPLPRRAWRVLEPSAVALWNQPLVWLRRSRHPGGLATGAEAPEDMPVAPERPAAIQDTTRGRTTWLPSRRWPGALCCGRGGQNSHSHISSESSDLSNSTRRCRPPPSTRSCSTESLGAFAGRARTRGCPAGACRTQCRARPTRRSPRALGARAARPRS
mmetsp:Transcript_104941/g.279184  ORF Transcript_104941/g.279184 Transcript_104941/m.279184 type:complete len:291 (-) Transcript_104941:1014-1886(-)